MLFLALGMMALTADDAPATLDVLPERLNGLEAESMTREYLLGRIEKAWARWQEDYEKRTEPAAIEAYQKEKRRKFVEKLGGFPERTPLNPRVTGIIERGGYTVEKVIFESQPKHFVTAALFVPSADRHEPPYPGVLVPCGHAGNAKAHDTYQSMGALLALNGMAALVFDPIDQGERGQYLEDGKPPFWGTFAHTMVGASCILLGQNTARFEVWDGMRGIDYLQSRPEVDAERIGCTGNSGGGTQTSYLMALDDRIDAAAPSCYINHQSRQLRTAPGDAEQNIYGQLEWGLDHPDFMMLRAPVPIKILAATHDFFEIEATWTTFRYAKRLYSRMGFSERVALLENDEEHNYDQLQREAGARWLARWLLGRDEAFTEPELELIPEEELWCTPNGQVMLLDGARSVYDLNRGTEARLREHREALWAAKPADELLAQVRELARIRPLAELPRPDVTETGAAEKDDVPVKKLVIQPEPGIYLPGLLIGPEDAARLVLYVNEAGKAADWPALAAMARDGARVLAVDPRGTGETRQTGQAKFGADIGLDWQDYFRAYVLGLSFVGMRAEDILTCARYLSEESDARPVVLIARGNLGVPALHAAALEPDLFEAVEVHGTLQSWSLAVEQGVVHNQLINTVNGALEVYDLPDLVRCLGAKLTVSNPVDALDQEIAGG